MRPSSPRFRFPVIRLLAVLCLSAGFASAQESFDFASHPFFKHLLGDWTTEGDVTFSDGHVVHSFQQWKAELPSPDVCRITGTHEWAGHTIHYQWTIRRMDSGNFEQILQPDLANPDTQRFEARVLDDATGVEMTAETKDHQKFKTIQSFTDKDHDQMEVKTEFADSDGTVIYKGQSVAKRHPEA
jgi:hypothetical protein